jgi:hypothetical protein
MDHRGVLEIIEKNSARLFWSIGAAEIIRIIDENAEERI